MRLPLRLMMSAPPSARDALYRAAGQVPAFDLQFESGSIVDVIGGITPTFTRPSSTKLAWNGSQFVEFAANVPAFQRDPVTGRLGYPHEPAATNSFPRSSDYGGGLNNVANVTITTSGPGVIPGQDRRVITGNAGNLQKRFGHTGIALSATGPYIMWAIIEAAGSTEPNIILRLNDQTGVNETRARVLTATGALNGTVALGGTTTNGVFTTQTLAPGLFLVALSATFTSPTSMQAAIWLDVYGNTPNTNAVVVHHFQVEPGTVPTSPIVTTGSAVTRAADTMTVSGTDFSSFFNQPAFTWYAEYAPQYTESATVPGRNVHVLQVDNAASTNNHYVIRGAEGSTSQNFSARNTTDGQLFQNITSVGFLPIGQARRVAFSISNGTLITAATGGTTVSGTNTRSANMAALDRLTIGTGTGGIGPQQLNGVLYRLVGFRAALDAARCSAMVA